jgi:hypothetical protein
MYIWRKLKKDPKFQSITTQDRTKIDMKKTQTTTTTTTTNKQIKEGLSSEEEERKKCVVTCTFVCFNKKPCKKKTQPKIIVSNWNSFFFLYL